MAKKKRPLGELGGIYQKLPAAVVADQAGKRPPSILEIFHHLRATFRLFVRARTCPMRARILKDHDVLIYAPEVGPQTPASGVEALIDDAFLTRPVTTEDLRDPAIQSEVDVALPALLAVLKLIDEGSGKRMMTLANRLELAKQAYLLGQRVQRLHDWGLARDAAKAQQASKTATDIIKEINVKKTAAAKARAMKLQPMVDAVMAEQVVSFTMACNLVSEQLTESGEEISANTVRRNTEDRSGRKKGAGRPRK